MSDPFPVVPEALEEKSPKRASKPASFNISSRRPVDNEDSFNVADEDTNTFGTLAKGLSRKTSKGRMFLENSSESLNRALTANLNKAALASNLKKAGKYMVTKVGLNTKEDQETDAGSLLKMELNDRDRVAKRLTEELSELRGDVDTRDNVKLDVPAYLIHPLSKNKQTWDFLILSLILYSSFAVPYQLTFGRESEPGGEELVINLLFIVDFISNFFTATTDKSCSTIQTSLPKIWLEYLKGWMLIDLVASIPWNFLSQGGSSLSSLTALKSLRLLRMARLLRLLKLFMLAKYKPLARFVKLNPTLLRIFRLLFLLALVSHLMACLVRTATLSESREDKELWLGIRNLESRRVLVQYWYIYYWTMSGMLGDRYTFSPR
eukprot:gene28037-34675_t